MSPEPFLLRSATKEPKDAAKGEPKQSATLSEVALGFRVTVLRTLGLGF